MIDTESFDDVAPAIDGFEAGQFNGPITEADREWLTRFGCEWPEEDYAWLTQMNALLESGSHAIDDLSGDDSSESAILRVLNARDKFITRYMPLSEKALTGLNEMPTGIPLDTLVSTQRLLFSYGIDGRQLLETRPSIIRFGADNLRQKIEHLLELGIQPTTSDGYLLSVSPDTIDIALKTLGHYGFSDETIKSQTWLFQHAEMFEKHDPDPQTLQETIRLLKELKLNLHVVVIHAPALLFMTADQIQGEINRLKSFGFKNPKKMIASWAPLLLKVDEYSESALAPKVEAMAAYGIDAIEAFQKYSVTLGLDTEELKDRLANLDELGFNVALLFGRNPRVLNVPVEEVRTRYYRLRNFGIDPVKAATQNNRLLIYSADTISERFMALVRNGIGAEAINRNAHILGVAAEDIDKRVANLQALGLNSDVVIARCPAILCLTEQTLERKYNLLVAIARLWHIKEPRDEVNRIVTEWPNLVTYSADKIRTVARIANKLFPSSATAEIKRLTVSHLMIPNTERLLVAYLENSRSLKTPIDLINLVERVRYKRMGSSVLLRALRKRYDNPIVKKHLRSQRNK